MRSRQVVDGVARDEDRVVRQVAHSKWTKYMYELSLHVIVGKFLKEYISVVVFCSLRTVLNHVHCVLPDAQTPGCHVVHATQKVVLQTIGEEGAASGEERVELKSE